MPERLRQAQALRRSGREEEALALVREALRGGRLDATQVERAGRFVRGARDHAGALRVLLLGQCTTAWLGNALAAAAWADGVALAVEEGAYDNVAQELLTRAPGSVDAVLLAPWSQRLQAGGDGDAEVDFWRRAWELATGRLGARVVQLGYDWVTPGPEGTQLSASEGRIRAVRRANEALREALPPGAGFVDVDAVAGTLGRRAFYAPRQYHWTRQPWSEAGVAELARHAWATLRALVSGPRKVLVLDLDDTLWGGVVGETGPLGVALGDSPDGEAFRAFQAHVKALAARGVVLAVASKNNPEDAREPFEQHPGMVLRLDDIAAFEASWEPKARALARVAATLSLGLDSFVFFDDSPAERDHIRQALPEVAVVPVPADPAEYVRALEDGLYFEAATVTASDLGRARQYAVERERREHQAGFADLDDYLRSLEMRGEVGAIGEADVERVVQLLGKTNQFNLTTRRHPRAVVERLARDAQAVAMTLRVSDRFGDHGLVGVILTEPADAATLRIDTWLMSCRVIGRGVEHFFFDALVERARARGYERLLGEYVPTRKNAQVEGLYPALGFRPQGEREEARLYALDLATATPPPSFVVPA